jgi:hypothetical protein
MHTPHRLRRTLAAACLCHLGLLASHLPGQLIPKRVHDSAGTAARKVGLSGLWTGNAREEVEGIGQMSFPIELRFSGDPAALRLDVAATVKVPAEGGQELTVKIAATYRGALQGADLRMRSERVETRIVELDQVVPSGPQVLEGRLADGALSGRVGSADEGWTTFTARPADGGGEAPPPSTSVAGTWRGTGREPGPDGRELSYPVTVTIAEQLGVLQVQMQADLRYPVEGGGTVPVRYRASFRGRSEGGELQLRSDSVQIDLVDQGRVEQGPPQRAVGRVTDGVLRLSVGDEQSGMSTLELRREAAGTPETPRVRNPLGSNDGPESGLDTPWPETPRTEPRGRDAGVGSAPAAYSTLVLERQEIKDPGMGGVVSHTMLVPQGWKFEGSPRWTPNPDNFVSFVGTLRGPQQEELSFGGTLALTFQTNSNQPAPAAPAAGQDRPDGSIFRQPPRQYGEVAAEILLPRLRPGATDVQVVEATRLPDVEEKVRTLYAAQLQMLEQTLQNTRQLSNPQLQCDASMFLVAERALIRYRQDGQQWEEEIRSTQFGTRYSMRAEFISTDSAAWQISDVVASRAPTGRLEACLPILLTISGSVQETPRWSTAVAEIRAGIAAARTRGAQIALEEQRKRGEIIARTQSDISDIQMQSWRSRQDSMDQMHKATIDSIRGTHDFQTAGGSVQAVSNQFDRAFTDPTGRLVLTNDPGFQAESGWQELQKVEPKRAGDGR